MRTIEQSIDRIEKCCRHTPGSFSWQYIRTYGGRHIVELFDDEKRVADKTYGDTMAEALNKLCDAIEKE